MKTVQIIAMACLLVGSVVLLAILSKGTDSDDTPPSRPATATTTAPAAAPIRIGLIPERDVIAQRKRYRALANHIASRLNRPVELATLNTYQAILQDFAQKRIDGAFLGSLIAVLAIDRTGGHLLLKSQLPDGSSTYRGVVFVREDSPIRSVGDLAGKSVAVVRTTTGGNLFPIGQMIEHGLLKGPAPPRLVWCGTHDEAILAVAEKRVDAGAVKDLRLNEFERDRADPRFRRLAQSRSVPDNALVLRSDLANGLSRDLRRVLLSMDADPDGAKALATFGAARFVPCDLGEYAEVYDLVEHIGDDWPLLGIQGPAPRRPASRPASSTRP
jgi:phosphonate transport system substrate-binding protein